MDLTHIRSLLSIADHGAIGEAAQTLNITQSALSRRIGLLEEELGAELLTRRGRGVALTEMGRLVVREGRELSERYDRLKEDVARHSRLEVGTVRIGGGATAVSFVLPEAIASFVEEHPEVRFEVREAGSREIAHAVQNETLELGIVTIPVDAPGLSVRPLVRDRIVLVAGKEHPLSSKKRIAASALSGLALVGFEAGSAIRHIIDTGLRHADITMNVVMELRSIPAILRMVETTNSLAFVSEMGAADARVVPVSGLRIERQLALVQKRDRPLSPAAVRFAQLVLRQARR